MSTRPTSRLWLFLVLVLAVVLSCVALDRCSRTRRPQSAAETILYALWQRVWYGDQIDRFNK